MRPMDKTAPGQIGPDGPDEPTRGKVGAWLRLGECPGFGASGERWVRARVWFLAVNISTNLLLFHLGGLSRARLLALCGLVTIPFGFAVLSVAHPRLRRLTPGRLWTFVLMGGLFMTMALALTGGVRSPLTPAFVTPVMVVVAVWGWGRPARVTAALFTTNAILLAALPPALTGPALPAPYFEVAMTFNLVLCVAFGATSVVALSEGFSSKSRVLETVREVALGAAAGRVRSLEQVGAKVAHELKNPLSAIKSLLQLEEKAARQAGDSEKSQKRLEVMSREVVRMEGILREYLSFSRPLEDLRVGATDLGHVADNVLALLEGRAAAASVRLVRAGGSVMLAADGRRLEEAVLNLASNALEATPAGGTVALEVTATRDGARLCVRDSGRGMSADVLARLGTPFFTTRKDGNGLGVVLARAVITQHGGSLDFASRPGEGTTATVLLPQSLPMANISPDKLHGPRAAG